jgi:hypothetical protein
MEEDARKDEANGSAGAKREGGAEEEEGRKLK